MTTKFQLPNKIMGSSSLMSGGCGHVGTSFIYNPVCLYAFCEDLEDSNVQTIHSLIDGNAISIDKKKMPCHFKVCRKICGQLAAYCTGTNCLVPAD